VREDHVGCTALERAKADQPLPAADVEELLTRNDARAVEDLVPNAPELLEHLAPHLRVAAVAVVRKPLRPDVALRGRAGLALGAFRRRGLHGGAWERERPRLRLRRALRLLARLVRLRLLFLLGEDLFLGGAGEQPLELIL